MPTAGYSRADVAGKISLIRPGTMALDYYDRAMLGQETDSNTGRNTGSKPGVGGVTTRQGHETNAPGGDVFGPITFAAGVTDDDQPVDTGNAFVEVGEVYAFFSVTGLR